MHLLVQIQPFACFAYTINATHHMSRNLFGSEQSVVYGWASTFVHLIPVWKRKDSQNSQKRNKPLLKSVIKRISLTKVYSKEGMSLEKSRDGESKRSTRKAIDVLYSRENADLHTPLPAPCPPIIWKKIPDLMFRLRSQEFKDQSCSNCHTKCNVTRNIMIFWSWKMFPWKN